jgi:hypothetical protein
MRKNDGRRIWTFAALVNEVDGNVIHLRPEVSTLIECDRLFPPVIRILPVIREFS